MRDRVGDKSSRCGEEQQARKLFGGRSRVDSSYSRVTQEAAEREQNQCTSDAGRGVLYQNQAG